MIGFPTGSEVDILKLLSPIWQKNQGKDDVINHTQCQYHVRTEGYPGLIWLELGRKQLSEYGKNEG